MTKSLWNLDLGKVTHNSPRQILLTQAEALSELTQGVVNASLLSTNNETLKSVGVFGGLSESQSELGFYLSISSEILKYSKIILWVVAPIYNYPCVFNVDDADSATIQALRQIPVQSKIADNNIYLKCNNEEDFTLVLTTYINSDEIKNLVIALYSAVK
ncbi:hypothetical protein [Deinococcus sp. 6GRE01]|uniref:hypothetical protein n=1 Tax=Deinococcus sp. 6GRE01 TaxID=2745873 RepID=UPI001E5068B8|nr:hypothetical protein [Deinococcus sp. 6GRE01]MCD0156839.1 hypothetical protein [Deinococcus sp. 6GRE01]